jgi:hypothetical protein
MPRLTWILATVIATSWLAVSAGADTLKEQAKKAVVAGLEAQSAGRYDEAIAYYRKAYDAVPHAEILFNLAQAYRLKGDAETALGLYQRYLLVEPRGRVAADAKKWVAALERVVAERKTDTKTDAKTTTAKPDSTKTDSTDAAKTDIAKTNPAKADPTKNDIRKTDAAKTDAAKTDIAKTDIAKTDIAKTNPAKADPTKNDIRNTDAAKTEAARTDIAKRDGERAGAARKAAPASGDAASADAPRRATPPRTGEVVAPMPLGEPRDDGGVLARHRYAVMAGAAGGAGVIGGAVFGLLARSKRNAAIAICGDDRTCDSAEDTSHANALLAASRARGTAATVLLVIGGAGIATGAVLWFTDRGSRTGSALAPVIAPSTVGIAWRGRF